MIVTGTGTGVGKTIVTAALSALAVERGARVAVIKPAQTGVVGHDPGDLAEVARLCGKEAAAGLTLVEGARYEHPLSPAAAARLRRQPAVDLERIATRVRALHTTHRLVLIEGAGGLLVRFDEDGATIAQLADACDAEVLVVTRAGLGSLNETALTLEALAGRGLSLAGLVIGAWPAEPDLACWSNVADFEMLAARPLGGALQADAAQLDPAEFLAAASAGLAPAFGGRFDPAALRQAASHALAAAGPAAS